MLPHMFLEFKAKFFKIKKISKIMPNGILVLISFENKIEP